MVPHIVIIDRDASAARTTRSLIWHIFPNANVAIGGPNTRHANLHEQQIDALILDPAENSETAVAEAQALQNAHPALVTVVLTSEPRGRRAQQLRGLKVDVTLDKSAAPGVLLDGLRSILNELVKNTVVARAGV